MGKEIFSPHIPSLSLYHYSWNAYVGQNKMLLNAINIILVKHQNTIFKLRKFSQKRLFYSYNMYYFRAVAIEYFSNRVFYRKFHRLIE